MDFQVICYFTLTVQVFLNGFGYFRIPLFLIP